MHITRNQKNLVLGVVVFFSCFAFWVVTKPPLKTQDLSPSLTKTTQPSSASPLSSGQSSTGITAKDETAEIAETGQNPSVASFDAAQDQYDADHDLTEYLRTSGSSVSEVLPVEEKTPHPRKTGTGFGVLVTFQTAPELPAQPAYLFGDETKEGANLALGYAADHTLQVLSKGEVVAHEPTVVLKPDTIYSVAVAHNAYTGTIQLYTHESSQAVEQAFRQEGSVLPMAQEMVKKGTSLLAQTLDTRVYARPISGQQMREEIHEMQQIHASQPEGSLSSSSASTAAPVPVLPFIGIAGGELSTFALHAAMLGSVQSVVTLPVEVLGREGLTKQVNISLTGAQANQAKHLWLQVNNLVYEKKGSVRVNGGAWTDFEHRKVVMNAQEKARGGMVQGGYNTIRFRLPINNFRAGNNSIVFRFNESDGISIGYRVLRIRVLNANFQNVLPDSQFVNENPNLWKAPFNGSGAVAAGKALWNKRNSLWNHYKAAGVEGFWHGYALPVRKRMTASCADCHTDDGRDLEMFSYSNTSIIERSKFHGLSDNQGKQIASYIRSLSGANANVSRAGRPWNPPYQPGPSINNRPIHDWAAGAGLNAVLDRDSDMVPYLFKTQPGQNPTQAQVNNFFKTQGGYDASLIPIAIQLPDWKHWLPMIHPIDAFQGGIWNNGVKDDRGVVGSHPSQALKEYRDFLKRMPKGNAQQIAFLKQGNNLDELKKRTGKVFSQFRNWWSTGSAGRKHWRSENTNAEALLKGDVPREWASTSLARLQSVKQFGNYNEFNLQDKHFLNATSKQLRDEYIPKRHWLTGRTYHVYPTGPHFTAAGQKGKRYRGKLIPSNSTAYLGQPRETGTFESTSWYELQAILTSGHLTGDVGGPVHYNYQMSVIKQASEYAQQYEGMRYFHTANRMYQSMLAGRQVGRVNGWKGSNAGPDRSRIDEGFEMRTMAPFYLFDLNGLLLESADSQYPGLGAKIAAAHLNQFMNEMERKNSAGQPLYNLNTWPRMSLNYQNPAGQRKNPMLDSRDKTGFDATPGFHAWADKLYATLLAGSTSSVSTVPLERLRNWCKRAWPKMPWDEIRLGTRGNFVNLTNPAVVELNKTATARVTFRNTGTADWNGSTGMRVGIYSTQQMPFQKNGNGLSPQSGSNMKLAWGAHRGYSDSHFFRLPRSTNGFRFAMMVGNPNNADFNKPKSISIYRNGNLLGNLTGPNPPRGQWRQWSYRVSGTIQPANYEIRVSINNSVTGNMAFDNFFVQNGGGSLLYRDSVEQNGSWVSGGDPRWTLLRAALPIGTIIKPNQTYTFQVPLRGIKLGRVNQTRFRLLTTGDGWFGPASRPVDIEVKNEVAQPRVAAQVTPQSIGADVYEIRVQPVADGTIHTVEWKVNGRTVHRNARFLPSYFFNTGDSVQVIVRSTSGNRSAFTQTYRVPRSAKANASRLPAFGTTVSLQGNNEKFVGVGANLSPMVCNRLSPNTWERFYLENAGSGRYYLRDYRGNYVSVRPDSIVEATSRQKGDAELFYLIATGNKISLQSRAGFYVSSLNGAGPMRCNRTKIGGWESFTWEARPRVIGNLASSEVLPSNGDVLALKANTGKHLTSINENQPAGFYANTIGAWERFRVIFVEAGRYALQAHTGKYLLRNAANQIVAAAESLNEAEAVVFSASANAITLQGEDNQYLSSENSNRGAKLSRPAAQSWEQFAWVKLN